MFGFGKKLNEDQKQAMREAQTKSAYSGQHEVAHVGDALASSRDGKAASIFSMKAKPGNGELNVKPSRFWNR